MPPALIQPLAGALLALLDARGVLVAVKDAPGRYLYANQRYAGFVGRRADELLGHTDLDVLPQADAAALRAADQRALTADAPSDDEHRFERGDAKHEFHATRLAVDIGQGPASGLVCLWWDETSTRNEHTQTVAQLRQALAQIERQQGAMDKLVGQQVASTARPTEPFRCEHFEEHARREFDLSTREHREFAVVLMTLDRAAQLEARFGAGAVKRVMDAVGQILRTNTRAMDVITRVGSDRYAILLSGVGLATAHTRMEQMRRQCATHIVVHDSHPLGFEVSVGIASFPHTSDKLDALSQAAETALLEAARRGGNRVALAPIPLGPRPGVAVA
jgi:diguanylate cyclase (GGDEF)-like protein